MSVTTSATPGAPAVAPDRPVDVRRRGWRPTRAMTLPVLFLALLAAIVVAAGAGQLHVPANEVIGSVLHRIGLDLGPMPTHPRGEDTLWHVRFPRVALAALVGAALAAAGAVMQGVFGNPLAEPGVVGVSAGAALAAAAVIVFDIAFLGAWTIAFAAFIGGLITTFIVYASAREAGRTEVVTLVLTGVAVNAMAGAALAYLMFIGDTQAREEISFWQLGSLNGARDVHVWVVGPVTLVGLIGAMIVSRRLDLLSLGDRAATHVGVDVERLRIVSIVIVALLTAAAVSFAGIIAFVGLVIPHVIRIVTGPAHALLVPASALGGAVLLVLADMWARTAVAYADLPIGMLTALVGGPVFFWLLRRTRRTAGGWA